MGSAEAADQLAGQMAGLSVAGNDGTQDAQQQAAQQGTQHHPGSPGPSSSVRVAGMEAALQAVRELVGWPLLYQQEAACLGLTWPKGLLLHGPPGCGKTLLVQAVAEEFGAQLHLLSASSVFGAYMGESERRLRQVFEAAAADAAQGTPAVVFLDEVDALCPRRDSQHAHEARVVAQLLTLLDGAAAPSTAAGSGPARRGAQPAHLVVIAATNRPNALDPALRRPGRLDREVAISVPDAQQRAAILRQHTRKLTLAPDVDLAAIAAGCHGYSGADLAALTREAAMHAFSAAAAQALASLGPAGLLVAPAAPAASSAAGGADSTAAEGVVSLADFQAALKRVGPSIVRGAEAEVEPVSWDDVGGLDQVKKRLRQAVEWPLLHADAFSRLGLSAPRGVLLYGPPGCSKTTLARAAATASGATLLPLSCAQLFSMYVGEGEALLRDTFKRARMAAPAIVFLDELDAVATNRAQDGSSGGGDASTRLLSTLLTEMDGMELATGVLVLAATNRPAALDSALMRPGRLDVQLYCPPPDQAGRLQVLQVHCRAMPLAPDVDLAAVAQQAEGFSGAELAALCREAALAALREDLQGAQHVAARHLEAAGAAIKPALTPFVLAEYDAWRRAHQS